MGVPVSTDRRAAAGGPWLPGALEERRRAARLPVHRLLLYVDGHACVGRGDVSVGGALWKGLGQARLPRRLVVGLEVPGLAHEVRVEAEVRSVRGLGELMGVHLRFSAPPPALARAIARYVDDWFLIADASGLLGG